MTMEHIANVISAIFCEVDSNDSLYVNNREGVTHKKVNIESDYIFESFQDYRETKVNPNLNHVTAYTKKFSISIITDFHVFL